MGIPGKLSKKDISVVLDAKDILEVIMSKNNKLPQTGRTKNQSIMLISFLVVAFLLLPVASSAWYNPFTWFDEDTTIIKTSGKWIEEYSTETGYFVWIEDSTKRNTQVCLLSNDITDKQLLPDKELSTKDKDTKKSLKEEPKIKATEVLKKDTGLYKDYAGYCYTTKETDEKIKFGKHSTVLVYEEEVLQAVDEDDNIIGEVVLTTDDWYYENSKPHAIYKWETNNIVHSFKIQKNQTYDDIFDNVYFVDLETNEIIEKDFNLKYLTYEEVEKETIGCISNITVYNGTLCNEYGVVETYTELEEVWLELTPEILNYNDEITVGVETFVERGDYIDVGFNFAGVDVGLFWASFASWNSSLYVENDDDFERATLGANWTAGNCQIYNSQYLEVSGATDDCTSSAIVTNNTPTNINWMILYSTPSTDAQSIYNFVYNGATNVMYFEQQGNNLRFITPSGGATTTLVTGVSSVTWYFMELKNIDWTAHTLDVYLNGVLKETGRSFAGADQFDTYKFVTTSADVMYVDYIYSELPNPSPPPSVVLVSPANNSNLTSSSISLVATVTDPIYVDNVTLYIDGVLNETRTTHVNGTYTFPKSFNEGVHNWSILAYNNNSLSNQSATWFFNYTAPPIFIDQISPDDFYETNNITVNMTCFAYNDDGVISLNMTIDDVLNQSVTNSSSGQNLTISVLLDFEDGEHTWSCSASDELSSSTSPTRNFTVDTAPFIDYITPPTLENYANVSQNYVPIKVNVSTLYFKNITYFLENTNGTSFTQFYENETYDINFTSVPDGHYHYNVTVCTTTNQCSVTDTRHINHDFTAPEITLTAPQEVFDYLIDGETLDLNWTVEDSQGNLDSCWHDYYKNNSDVFSGVVNLSLYFDGSYTSTNWLNGLFYVDDYINELVLVSYNPAHDCSSPLTTYNTLDISGCSSEYGLIQINTTEAANVFSIICDAGTIYTSDHSGFSTCGYQKPSEIYVNKTNLDCSLNTTTFNYIQGENDITFFANDTFGNIANETRSWSSIIGTFSIEYESTVYEGYSNEITATIEGLTEGSSLTSAKLYYNGNNYTTSINYDGDSYEITSTLSAPAVTVDTNYSFGFYLTIDGDVYDPQTNNQTVLNANFGECGGLTNDTILSLNLVDEDTQVDILGDIEIGGEIKSVSSDETIGTIYVEFTNTTNASLCFSPPSAYDLYYIDAEIRYTSEGYSSELYYIQNADITEDLGNLTLYDLNESSSTRFKVTYQDSTYNFVEGAIIQLQRRYISEGVYKTVEAPLTSSDGVSVLHINLDSIGYRATVVKDGVVLDEFENLVFNCQSELTGECEYKLLGIINPGNEQNLDDTRDFYYSNPVLINGSITTSFSIPSSSPSTVNIVLEQKDQFGNKTLCNRTIISSAGSVSCNYSETLGKSYIEYTIYKNGEAMAKKSYVVNPTDYLDWLDNNYIFIFVLLLSLVGMALTSPEWIIINGIMTMVISGGLYLARGLDFVVGLGNIVWLIIAAIILISKISKQEDR